MIIIELINGLMVGLYIEHGLMTKEDQQFKSTALIIGLGFIRIVISYKLER